MHENPKKMMKKKNDKKNLNGTTENERECDKRKSEKKGQLFPFDWVQFI